MKTVPKDTYLKEDSPSVQHVQKLNIKKIMKTDLITVLENKLKHYKERLIAYSDKNCSGYKCTFSRVQLIEELLAENLKYDMVPYSEMEEFGRKAFYGGRMLKDPRQSSPGFKHPTYNGFLRELDTKSKKK